MDKATSSSKGACEMTMQRVIETEIQKVVH